MDVPGRATTELRSAVLSAASPCLEPDGCAPCGGCASGARLAGTCLSLALRCCVSLEGPAAASPRSKAAMRVARAGAGAERRGAARRGGGAAGGGDMVRS